VVRKRSTRGEGDWNKRKCTRGIFFGGGGEGNPILTTKEIEWMLKKGWEKVSRARSGHVLRLEKHHLYRETEFQEDLDRGGGIDQRLFSDRRVIGG